MKKIELFEEPHLRAYNKGQILLYQGEKTESVFVIKKGYVRVKDITSKGTEKILLILGPGDIFPLVWTFGKSQSLHYFYEAHTDVEVKVGSRKELVSSIKKSHEVSNQLLEYFVSRIKELMTRIETIEAGTSLHKICYVLLYLSRSCSKRIAKSTYKTRFPITQQEIASMTGVSRETASLQLTELEKLELLVQDSNGLLIYAARIDQFLDKQST